MTKITSFDLAPLYRTTIGMDRLFDRITSQIDISYLARNFCCVIHLRHKPLYRTTWIGLNDQKINQHYYKKRWKN